MDVTSLAWRTDLALLTYGGAEVEDHGDHLVVRTPTNPHFYWGNFLLLPSAPTEDAVGSWLSVFEQTFPDATHRAIGVDGASGSVAELAALAAAGFEVEASTVMTASSVHPPPRPDTEAEIRPLVSEDDWAQQVEVSLEGEEDSVTEEFVRARVAMERAVVEAGHGRWWGAFLDGRLSSSLGLLEASPGLARFQEVKTAPAARGRGLAGTLVHTAARWALDDVGVETLVMVADPDYLAIRIYRSVGFDDTEMQLQATRAPGS